MIKVDINLNERSYPIYITKDYTGFVKSISDLGIAGKIALITDTNVDKYQCEDFVKYLEQSEFYVSKYVIEAGEHSKTLETTQNIYKFLYTQKVDRSSTVIALGGGVTGDVAGFAASTYLRGINFIQVPTSLLAQADSGVGGKVGVDFKGAKNLIGSFYQPRMVYININTLRTLPVRELKSGLAETIKHGIICDEDFFEYISCNIEKIFLYDEIVLMDLAKRNCEIKGFVVERDENENGLREVLNFGHTIGHAVESVTNFKLLHGECVSIGIIGAFKMAELLGFVEKNLVSRVEKTLKNAELPVKLPSLDLENLYNQMLFDKKVRNGRISFILPERIGKIKKYKTNDKSFILKVLDMMR